MVVAIAVILQYMIGGTAWTEDRLAWLRPRVWIGAGLLLAAGTGLAALGFGRPFLTSYIGYLDLPVIGQVPTASALLFDIGVFALVVGATSGRRATSRPLVSPARTGRVPVAAGDD
jgi:multicomponent K+:H+ antiporter subunit A